MKYLFVIITILFFSCGEEENLCYAFQQRQCRVDPWFPLDGQSLLVDNIETYIESNDIKVNRITLFEQIDGSVCAACDVCPDGIQIIVDVRKKDKEKIEALNLLNIRPASCFF